MKNIIWVRGGMAMGLLAWVLAMNARGAEAPGNVTTEPAGNATFRVYVVAGAQSYEHYLSDHLAATDSGVTRIYLPGAGWGPPKGADFYVAVQNAGANRVGLDYMSAEWYDCLSFNIKGAGGMGYLVHRKFRVWDANAFEPWNFEPGGMKVLEVNFNDDWVGVPTTQEIDVSKRFKIQASFRYTMAGDQYFHQATSDWVDATW
jgi:hypothetical protein